MKYIFKRSAQLIATALFSLLLGYCVIWVLSWILPLTYMLPWWGDIIYLLSIRFVHKICIFTFSPIMLLNAFLTKGNKICKWLATVIYSIYAINAVFTCFALDGLDYGLHEYFIAVVNSYILIQIYLTIIMAMFLKE